jgi:hypothetical protein
MVFAEVNRLLTCNNLKKIAARYGTMFNYACLNISDTQFTDIAEQTVLLFQHDISERLVFDPNSKIENILQFP